MTRRGFAARLGLAAAGAGALTEAAFAQRAMVRGGELPANMVWLNANENPAGPPPAALEAMSGVLPSTGRYHFQEFGDFYDALARSEGVEPRQIMVGSGSTEVLHAAVDAFTTASRPLIAMYPSFEGPMEVAGGLGRPIVRVPVTSAYAADVRKMAEAAGKAGGGLNLHLQPEQPHRHGYTGGGYRLARAQPAREHRCRSSTKRISTSAPRPASERARLRAAGQGRVGYAHVLQALRHGGAARGLRLRAAGVAGAHVALPQQRDLGGGGARGDGRPAGCRER